MASMRKTENMLILFHKKSIIPASFKRSGDNICSYSFSFPSPAIRLVKSSIFSFFYGGRETGFIAIDISFMGLSSAAIRLEERAPHLRQRWITAHSPFLRTHTAIGSIMPPQSDWRSPGSISTWRLHRQFGQWLRWSLPAPAGTTSLPHTLQVKLSWQGWVL